MASTKDTIDQSWVLSESVFDQRKNNYVGEYEPLDLRTIILLKLTNRNRIRKIVLKNRKQGDTETDLK